DTKAVGRIGGKAMLWFVSASLVSLLLGLIMVNILRPGDYLNLPLPDVSASTNLNAASLSFKDFVAHLVPKSAVEAMANNELVLIGAGLLFLGGSVFRLISLIRAPFLLGFSTASSEAAYGPARKASGQQENHQLCAADGVFVQSRRLDDVLHFCDDLHLAGLQHTAVGHAAGHDVAGADADQQGDGRSAARFAGGDRRDAGHLQPPGGRSAADYWNRSVPRYGPHRHQRHRQQL